MINAMRLYARERTVIIRDRNCFVGVVHKFEMALEIDADILVDHIADERLEVG